MILKETANKEMPTVMLLHGGGLSSWSWQGVAALLQTDYHVVTPILEGHGEKGDETFLSIGDSAQRLIEYIDAYHHGHVFAIGGLSIGAQILTEILTRRPDIVTYAVVESALVYPIKGITAMTVPTYRLFYGLVKQRWFAKLQAKTLCVPGDLFEQYYRDSLKMSKQSLINLTVSNGSYQLGQGIARTQAKTLIIVGEKELGIMKKSARRLHEAIPGSMLHMAPAMKHGEMSLRYPDQYAQLLMHFFAKG